MGGLFACTQINTEVNMNSSGGGVVDNDTLQDCNEYNVQEAFDEGVDAVSDMCVFTRKRALCEEKLVSERTFWLNDEENRSLSAHVHNLRLGFELRRDVRITKKDCNGTDRSDSSEDEDDYVDNDYNPRYMQPVLLLVCCNKFCKTNILKFTHHEWQSFTEFRVEWNVLQFINDIEQFRNHHQWRQIFFGDDCDKEYFEKNCKTRCVDILEGEDAELLLSVYDLNNDFDKQTLNSLCDLSESRAKDKMLVSLGRHANEGIVLEVNEYKKLRRMEELLSYHFRSLLDKGIETLYEEMVFSAAEYMDKGSGASNFDDERNLLRAARHNDFKISNMLYNCVHKYGSGNGAKKLEQRLLIILEIVANFSETHMCHVLSARNFFNFLQDENPIAIDNNSPMDVDCDGEEGDIGIDNNDVIDDPQSDASAVGEGSSDSGIETMYVS